jgi:hypothetical protein
MKLFWYRHIGKQSYGLPKLYDDVVDKDYSRYNHDDSKTGQYRAAKKE